LRRHSQAIQAGSPLNLELSQNGELARFLHARVCLDRYERHDLPRFTLGQVIFEACEVPPSSLGQPMSLPVAIDSRDSAATASHGKTPPIATPNDTAFTLLQAELYSKDTFG
tara:strand:- start:135 stop:470 length:336 start_codon:yes stop_codon:yes gene_type:complete